jgi:glycosyltransferase involved in cell wall biosynthesis
MRILHVVQGYTPAIGGTERLIQKISEKLVQRYGDEVTVFTTTAYNCELFWRRDQPELPAGEDLINGVRVRRYRVFNRFNELRRALAGSAWKMHLPFNDWLRAWYNGPLIPRLAGDIARFNADVVAASSFPLLHMHDALRGAHHSHKPMVFHGGIHTADAFGFDRPMIIKAIKQAEAYIANSVFERDYLVKQGVPAEKITVVGVGVDIELFEQASSAGRALRERLGWGDAPVVAFVGQQVPHKGIDLVIEAIRQLWADRPEICLLVAGARTTYSTVIAAWIAQLPPDRQQRVAVLDDFDEVDKPAVFGACDMLVFPSGHESFGIVLVEAWAARKPVIGVRVGAIPTVVDEDVDGLLIEHRNAADLTAKLRILIDQPELRHRLGEAGHAKVVQRYTWNIVADRFREVYVQTGAPITRAD